MVYTMQDHIHQPPAKGNLNKLVHTSVMIIFVGASLSKQHTDLLICHCTKQDLSRTSRYLGLTYDKPTARTATVVCLQMHELSFTLKS